MAQKKKMNLVIPIAKIDEAQRLVYGIAAIEKVDKTKEILDYESSKPNFQAWSDEFSKATNGKSLGNLREMHENSAVGKLIEFTPNDELKQFEVCAKVIDDEAWEKVSEGVYTGFSIGGEYERRWNDPDLKNVKRYTAKPSEISLVDNPCIPGAVFEYMKADGAVEMRKFAPQMTESDVDRVATAVAKKLTKAEKKTKAVDGKELHSSDFAFVGDPQDTETWKLPIHDENHVKNALARFNQTDDLGDKKAAVAKKLVAAAKKYGIDTKGFEEEYVKVTLPNLKKGLFDVSRLACLLMELNEVRQCLQWEAEYEADGSPIPQQLVDQINNLCNILVDLVSEETGELVASTGIIETNKIATVEIEKMKKSFDTAMTKLASSTDPEVQKMVPHLKEIGKCVDGMTKCHEDMGKGLDTLEGKDGKTEDVSEGDAKDVSKVAPHLKEIGKSVEKIRKAHTEMKGHLDTLNGNEASDKEDDGEGEGDDEGAEKAMKIAKSAPVEDPRVAAMEKSISEQGELIKMVAEAVGNLVKLQMEPTSTPVKKSFSPVAINGQGVTAISKEADGVEVKKAVAPIKKNAEDMTTEEQFELIKSLKETHQTGGTPYFK